MNDCELDKDEQSILDEFESGAFVEVPELATRKKALEEYAKNH